MLELLIVIGILAVLMTVVVSVLNPAEYLAQSRDSRRMADLDTLSGAIALYLATADSPDFGACANYVCTASGSLPGGTTACGSISSSTAKGGSGWVAIDFDNISGGSPIAKEPIDPVNNVTYKYAYKCDNTAKTYELDADMESIKFRSTGGKATDVESKDGGNNNNAYEVGSDLTLIPAT